MGTWGQCSASVWLAAGYLSVRSVDKFVALVTGTIGHDMAEC